MSESRKFQKDLAAHHPSSRATSAAETLKIAMGGSLGSGDLKAGTLGDLRSRDLKSAAMEAAAGQALKSAAMTGLLGSESLKTGMLGDQKLRDLKSGAREATASQALELAGGLVAAEALALIAASPPAIPVREAPPAPILVPSPAALGEILRQAREAMGLTQMAFADAAGVGRRFVSELENGKATLELGKVMAVCAAAGVDLLVSRR